MKTDKKGMDRMGEYVHVDADFAELVINTYRNIKQLKAQLQAIPYLLSEELFAGSHALTYLLNNALEDMPKDRVLQNITSGIALTQRLIKVNSSIDSTTQEISGSLEAILANFQLLQSTISFKVK